MSKQREADNEGWGSMSRGAVVDLRHHFGIRSVTSERDIRSMRHFACRINPRKLNIYERELIN